MFNSSHFLGKYAMITIVSLVMLTLFDGNPWWKVLFFAIPATLLNLYLTGMTIQKSLSTTMMAVVQAVVVAFLAFLISLTTLLRATFGTLVGFAVLLSLADYVLVKLFLGSRK